MKNNMKPIKIPVRKSIWWYLRNEDFQMNCTFITVFVFGIIEIIINIPKIPFLYFAVLPIITGIYFFTDDLIRIIKK